MMNNIVDLAILGSGPAGCSAAIYASRAGMSTLLFEGSVPGGQLTTTTEVENYPGFEYISGYDLMEKMLKHATAFGAKSIEGFISSVNLTSSPFNIIDENGELYMCRSIIFATGSNPRLLEVDGERHYYGSGVSYCAVCDGFFFKNKDVAVIGGGNSAVESVLYLSKIANSVTLIHRRDELRAEHILQKSMAKLNNVSYKYNVAVQKFDGDGKALKNIVLSDRSVVNVSGAFVNIGHIPVTDFIKDSGIEVMESGHIAVCKGSTGTNIPGVYVAGDVMDSAFMQAVTSSGFGCMAALEAGKYLDSIKA